MYTKQITLPLSVMVVAPDSWTAEFDGERVVYIEHFKDADPETLARTVEVIRALFGSSVEVDPIGDGVMLVFPTIQQGLAGIMGELISQMVVRDLLPESTMHQIIALLRAPQLPTMSPSTPSSDVIGRMNPHAGVSKILSNDPTPLELQS